MWSIAPGVVGSGKPSRSRTAPHRIIKSLTPKTVRLYWHNRETALPNVKFTRFHYSGSAIVCHRSRGITKVRLFLETKKTISQNTPNRTTICKRKRKGAAAFATAPVSGSAPRKAQSPHFHAVPTTKVRNYSGFANLKAIVSWCLFLLSLLQISLKVQEDKCR